MTDLNIVSLNVRGLKNNTKRRALFNWVREQKADVTFFQETYSNETDELLWKNEYGGNILFVHGTNHSRGIMILLKNGLDIEILDKFTSPDGRICILKTKTYNKVLYYISIYAPNEENAQLQFFHKLNLDFQRMDISAEDSIIVGGDFNINLSNLDKKGGSGKIKQKVVDKINTLCTLFDLEDIWRIKNPEKRGFTWRQKSPLIQCRLDYFLTSRHLQENVISTNIIPSLKSDHSAINLNIVTNLDGSTRGPGYWKFNASLLNDPEYTNMIKQNIIKWKQEYRSIEDDKLKWELIKYNVRKSSIAFAKTKTVGVRCKERELVEKIKILEQNLTTENHETYQNLCNELEKIKLNKAQGNIIRSKVRWFEQGEKSTKYFFNLEKRNQIKKNMQKVCKTDGTILTKPKEILKEVEDFYENLYMKSEYIKKEKYPIFLGNGNIPKLNEIMKNVCEGEITKSECLKALKCFKNGKSPGNDGLGVEFYIYFWNDISDLMMACYNKIFDTGLLTKSQRQAIITLIDKKDKDRTYIKNWRPISLLNLDFKIISKVLSMRLIKVLPELISNTQSGYMKGRQISDAIRTIIDIMEYVKEKEMPAMLIGVDYEKAFDSLDWDFLFKCLETYNFGNTFIKWVKILYTDIESCVLINGHTSAYFKIQRGVRQGDCLSPYLFILALEMLTNKIKCDDNIEGVCLNNHVFKILQYADDTTGIFKDKKSLKHFISVLEDFNDVSGLKINIDKTEAMWIGSKCKCVKKPLNLSWKESNIKLLGVYLGYDTQEIINLNFDGKIEQVKTLLNIWRNRNLTINGRILISKSLCYSKFYYITNIFTLENIKCKTKVIENTLQNFIWKNKKPMLEKKVLYCSYEKGGQKRLSFEAMLHAQKIMWLKRALTTTNCLWSIVLDYYLKQFGGLNILLYCNYDYKWFKKKYNISEFYVELLKLWNNTEKEVSKEIIWNNKNILIDGKPIFYKKFMTIGIWYVTDLFTEQNEIIEYDIWLKRGLCKNDFLKWRGLIDVIKKVINLHSHYGENLIIYFSDHDKSLNNMTTNDFYWLSINNNYSSAAKKILTNKYGIDDHLWRNIFTLPLICTVDQKLKEFQYKCIHNILWFNNRLYKIGKVDTPNCIYCNDDIENREHCFVNCPITSVLWKDLCTWLNKTIKFNVQLSEKDIILGYMPEISNSDMKCKVINLLILITKYYIYCTRFDNAKVTFAELICKIKKMNLYEKMYYTNKNKLQIYLAKWDNMTFS